MKPEDDTQGENASRETAELDTAEFDTPTLDARPSDPAAENTATEETSELDTTALDASADDTDSDESEDGAPTVAATGGSTPQTWRPIPARQRRLLAVMMEKAKTTPDSYPLSLSSLIAGANQKSNRAPLMALTPEQVEDDLTVLRRIGAAAEIQGSGRVPRYRHYGHAWLGVKGPEAAVMIELLLRGHQTMGDLRTRASRIEPIADLATLQTILQSLIERNMVIALTPAGRGQLFTHNLYMPEELETLKARIAAGSEAEGGEAAPRKPSAEATRRAASELEKEGLRTEVTELRAEVLELRESIAQLQQRLEELGETAQR